MAFSKEMEALMADQAFAESLDAMETKEEISAAFAAKGVDVVKEMELDKEVAEAELSEDDLEDAAGGVATATIALIISAAPLAWKVGTSAGILIRAAYDAKKYGNPYRSYSKKKVDSILKKLNLM